MKETDVSRTGRTGGGAVRAGGLAGGLDLLVPGGRGVAGRLRDAW